ncbi:membrane hypothetical protein [Agrobacterium sp. NCPPB 925]|nr:membrane hypothetical protein [Agrobacterium sp. NCPPB 925]
MRKAVLISTRDPRVLLALMVFLGVLPFVLRLLDVRPSLLLGASIFFLNLVVCLLGAATRYRFLWLTYGVACVFAFVLFGMPSPLSLVLLLLATFRA